MPIKNTMDNKQLGGKAIIWTGKVLSLLFLLCSLTASLLGQQESLLIGPGDQLHVEVFDTPELEETALVTDNGELPLMLGGSIKVAGLTSVQAASAIEKVLIDKQIMNHPRVLVTVITFATQSVTVYGQVVRPGPIQITTPRSILDILTLAGGLTDLADRHVTIERQNGSEPSTVFISNDSKDALKQDVLIYPGDRVLVPKTGIVYVLGDVTRPGGYPMANNESSLTVLGSVALAGGTLNSAVPSHARLIRRTPGGGYENIPLPLGAMQKGKKPDITMQASDIVYIPFSYLLNIAVNLNGVVAAATAAVIYEH